MLHNIQKNNHVGVLFYLLYRGRTNLVKEYHRVFYLYFIFIINNREKVLVSQTLFLLLSAVKQRGAPVG